MALWISILALLLIVIINIDIIACNKRSCDQGTNPGRSSSPPIRDGMVFLCNITDGGPEIECTKGSRHNKNDMVVDFLQCAQANQCLWEVLPCIKINQCVQKAEAYDNYCVARGGDPSLNRIKFYTAILHYKAARPCPPFSNWKEFLLNTDSEDCDDVNIDMYNFVQVTSLRALCRLAESSCNMETMLSEYFVNHIREVEKSLSLNYIPFEVNHITNKVKHILLKILNGNDACLELRKLSEKCQNSKCLDVLEKICNESAICKKTKHACPGPSCHTQICENIENCSATEGERGGYVHVADRACQCSSLSDDIRIEVPRCRPWVKSQPPTLQFLERIGHQKEKGVMGVENARNMAIIQAYKGNARDLLKFKKFEKLIPASSLTGITIDDIQTTVSYEELSDPKKLVVTRVTIGNNPQESDITTYYRKHQCAFLSGLPLNAVDYLTANSAFMACHCIDIPTVRSRVDRICDVLFHHVSEFTSFANTIKEICPTCLVYILRKRDDWKELVLKDTSLTSTICSKLGNSFLGDIEALTQWANMCGSLVADSPHTCMFPSFVGLTPVTTTDQLARCSDILCANLCALPPKQIDTIKRLLEHSNGVAGLKCLTFLGTRNFQQVTINPDAIKGRCPERSKLLYKYEENRRKSRRRRQLENTCDIFCDSLMTYIDADIELSHLDVNELTSSNCINFECTERADLGHQQWNRQQAYELLKIIKESNTIDVDDIKSSGLNLEILGYISLAFTPDELRSIKGITDRVFEVYGAVHGWHPDQLKVLASRYLNMKGKTTAQLALQDIAVLGHIICGFDTSQINEIGQYVIGNSTTILGDLKQCTTEVLVALVSHLRNLHGHEVHLWPEEHYSEFGIMNAGLSGQELAATGTRIVDHLTIPFINHVQPYEFGRMTQQQLELFTIDQAIAVERIGLCPYLSSEQKIRNVGAVCGIVSDAFILVHNGYLLLAMSLLLVVYSST